MRSIRPKAGVIGAAAIMLIASWTIPAAAQDAVSPSLEQLKNATYKGIYDKPVTLKGGAYEGQPFAKDSPMRPSVGFVDALIARGDIDRDGRPEAAVILWEHSGGSGSITYLAIVADRGGRAVNAATAEIGDRVQIRSMVLSGSTVTLEVVAHGPDDPMCCPAEKQRRTWDFAGGALKERPRAVLGKVGLADLEGQTWTLASFDAREPLPAGVDVTLEVKDGTVSGRGGCNRYSGAITAGADARSVTIGPLVSTKMACAPPRDAIEARFVAALNGAFQYGFSFGSLDLAYNDKDGIKTLVFTAK